MHSRLHRGLPVRAMGVRDGTKPAIAASMAARVSGLAVLIGHAADIRRCLESAAFASSFGLEVSAALSATPSSRAAAVSLTACRGGDDTVAPSNDVVTIPEAPRGLGCRRHRARRGRQAALPPFVDNSRDQPARRRRATPRWKPTPACACVAGFLDIWQPPHAAGRCRLARAGPRRLPGRGGLRPGRPARRRDRRQGAQRRRARRQHRTTWSRPRAAAPRPRTLAAYLDDRRGKGYSVTDGMGPLTAAWRTPAADAPPSPASPPTPPPCSYNDGGNDIGVGGSANAELRHGGRPGQATSARTAPPSRPSASTSTRARGAGAASVKVVPALRARQEPHAGHRRRLRQRPHGRGGARRASPWPTWCPSASRRWCARGLVLGENRILAGMHSPLDVMGGRIQGMAVAAASLAHRPNKAARKARPTPRPAAR